MGPKQVTKRQAQSGRRSWRVNAATWSFSKRNSSELRRQEERREAIHSLALLSVGGSVGDHLGNWKMSYCWGLEYEHSYLDGMTVTH